VRIDSGTKAHPWGTVKEAGSGKCWPVQIGSEFTLVSGEAAVERFLGECEE
jgi:hypothetical protein